MRGDSLRDFYAKTLAVLGLGVLAATGAAVDYWPVSEDWPTVAEVSGLQPAVSALAQDLNRQIPAPMLTVHTPRPAALPLVSDRFIGFPAAEESAVGLDPLPAPAPEDFVQVNPALPVVLLANTINLAPVPVADPTPEESRRLLGDAARRTRESLTAARVFLNDAFSGLAGAFRRVSPFFATGAAGVVGPTQDQQRARQRRPKSHAHRRHQGQRSRQDFP